MIPTVVMVIPPMHSVVNVKETIPVKISVAPIIPPGTGLVVNNSTGIFLPEPATIEVTEYPHQIEVLNISHPDVAGDATQYEVTLEAETTYTQTIITLTPETETVVIGTAKENTP